ncbi:MAG: TonB-dependent receptor, partial [Candidatus Acidiferrales bacterium]
AIEKGAISGIVKDPSGAVVTNATVKVTSVATKSQRTMTTDSNGRYVADILPPGEYTIEVSASGFATTIVRNVHVSVGQSLVQDVDLQLAAVGQTVEVTAAGGIDKSDALANSVLNQTYIDQLPINGRDFRDFISLAPTVQDTPGLRSPLRLGGQFGEFTGLIIDGVDNRNSFFGEWFGSLETRNFTLPQDAIQEFQVRPTGFSAEFGHATGGLVNVVTKSGTNDWHGTAHWFFQHRSMVMDPCTPATGCFSPQDKRRHQFGGSIGGPVARDKAFILFAVDREDRAGPLTIRFGTDPTGIAVPELGIADLGALQGEAGQGRKLLTPVLKFDWKITERNTWTTKFNYTENKTRNFTPSLPPIRQAESSLEDFKNEGFSVAETLTSVFNPTTVNEFRFAFSQEIRPRSAKGPGPLTTIFDTGQFGRALFLPIDSEHQRYQFMDNFSKTFGKHDLKLGVDYNANGSSQVFIGFASGAYFFSSLADFDRGPGERRPLFMLQLFGINGFDAIGSGVVPYFWQHELSFYIQDTWRATHRLTINYGLRWDGIKNPQTQFTDVPGDVVVSGRPRRQGDTVVFDEFIPVPTAIPNDYDNWAPRVGVAYDVMGNGKTILRGGMGWYYTSIPTIFMAEILSGVGQRNNITFIPFPSLIGATCLPEDPAGFDCSSDLLGFNLNYPDLLPSAVSPPDFCTFEQSLDPGTVCNNVLPPPQIRYADPSLESPRVFNFQAGLEREFFPNFSISATYSYNRSDDLRIGSFFENRYDRNFVPPSAASDFDQFGRVITNSCPARPTPGPLAGCRLDPTLGVVDALTSFGRARYHAFIFQAKKALSNHYQFGINYTWSTNKDNVTSDRDTDSVFPPTDPFNLDLDYGRGQLDVRHQLSAYLYAELPGKIDISTQFRARSGLTFPAYGGVCGTADTNGDANCGSFVGTYDPDRPVVSSGLLPRFPARQPSFSTWDFRVGRDFGSERAKVRLTFEIFDLLNDHNAFCASGIGNANVFGDPNFGCRATGLDTAGERNTGSLSTQFGMKFIF